MYGNVRHSSWFNDEELGAWINGHPECMKVSDGK